MGVSRLHQIAHVLKVPIEFFYEGAPSGAGAPIIVDQNARSMTAFLGTPEGVKLVKAFMAIRGAKVRRHILDLTRAAASGKERIDGRDGRTSISGEPRPLLSLDSGCP